MTKKTKNTKDERAYNLRDSIGKNMRYYVIIKDGNIVGKLFSKYGKSSYGITCRTGLTLHTQEDYFAFYEHCNGYGYSMQDNNISRIMYEHKETLENIGLNMTSDTDYDNHWKEIFKNAGYIITQVC